MYMELFMICFTHLSFVGLKMNFKKILIFYFLFTHSFICLAIFFLIAGPQVVENLFLEVIRAFYSYCRDALGSDLKLSYTQSGSSVIR